MEKQKQKCVKKSLNIWMDCLLEKEVILNFVNVGNNLKKILTDKLKRELEGKCSENGYIKENSIDILTYSTGLLEGDIIRFNVNFKCKLCNPVEGMIICVQAKNITKAGVRALYPKGIYTIEVLIPRDWHYNSKIFSEINVEDLFIVKVVGQRYELGDEKIEVMCEVVNKVKEIIPKQKKISIK